MNATAQRLCLNAAAGTTAWWCHHYGNRITPGTNLAPGRDRCRACHAATPPYEHTPTWMRNG